MFLLYLIKILKNNYEKKYFIYPINVSFSFNVFSGKGLLGML